jgi:hypothetical protein
MKFIKSLKTWFKAVKPGSMNLKPGLEQVLAGFCR